MLEIVLLLDPVKITGAVEYALDEQGRREVFAFFLQFFDQLAESVKGAAGFLAYCEFLRADNVPERFAGIFGARFQGGDGSSANASRRNVQDAQERDIVFGMKQQA